MNRLEGKVAIVTGGSGGLGSACARRLAMEGAAVMLTDRRDDGEAVAATLRAEGLAVQFMAHDISDRAAWDAVVSACTGQFGGLDILVNNAGISRPADIEALLESDLRATLDINLFGVMHGMQAAIPAMCARGGGAIVNMCSALTEKVITQSCAYSASKAAIASLTKSAAVHCARQGYGIRINSVHPGPHDTQMLSAGMDQVGHDKMVHMINSSIPMGRIGQPADVAGVVAFLVSADAAYVTAAEIMVDGGLVVV